MSPMNPNHPTDRVDPFAVLNSERRRWALYFLVKYGATDLRELSERMTEQEHGPEYRSKERKRVYVGLYQCHMGKLEDWDLIEYDADRKWISPTGKAREVVEFMLDGYEAFELDNDPADYRGPISDGLSGRDDGATIEDYHELGEA